MILWTIQSEKVYKILLNQGYYHCDFSQSHFQGWKSQYDWLADQMRKRVGEPPEGVTYPVWAWHTWEKDRRKPDLRSERWGNGWKGDRFVRIEIDIPDSEVLCSDFDEWSVILLDGFLSDSEEEDNQLETVYNTLPPDQQQEMKSANWERVFNLDSVKNDWTRRGECIQATFWELKRDQIRNATFFTSANPRPKYIDEQGNIIEKLLPKSRRRSQLL